jgi:hypothetical protein
VVTQDDVDLAPIDLLWAVRPVGRGGDDRPRRPDHRRRRRPDHPRPDAELTIQYTSGSTDKVTFFELSPLIAALRTLLTTARPLRPTDLVPAAGTGHVDRAADDAVSVPRQRPAAVRERSTTSPTTSPTTSATWRAVPRRRPGRHGAATSSIGSTRSSPGTPTW